MNRRFLKTVSAMLLLAMTIQTMPAAVMADAAVTEETVFTGTFENVSENGEDMISLSEARSYKAMIPVDGEVDPADVTWTMTRNLDKPYNTAEKYPNQVQGGTLDAWKATNGENFFSEVTTTVETVDGMRVDTAVDTSVDTAVDTAHAAQNRLGVAGRLWSVDHESGRCFRLVGFCDK